VWMQLAIGIAFVLGAATRLAGLLCALTFVIGIAFIHARDDLRAIWPALALVLIGFDLFVRGGGRWSADAVIARRTATAAA
jgi:putative oxidoreductase